MMIHFLNNRYVRITLTLFLFHVGAHAQSSTTQKLEITYNKTSSLIFPTAITSVDRGSRDVLAQKAKGVNNILQLKAGKTNFRETNLTVITADGHLHHFVVRYADSPSSFTVPVMLRDNAMHPLLFESELMHVQLEALSRQVVADYTGAHVKRHTAFDMALALEGIYIHGNTMLYHVSVTNWSNIPFHTDMLRFAIRDKKQTKRTASQEIEALPFFRHGDTSVIPPKSTIDVVYAIPKFTIPDAKRLHIELKEMRGGRHLQLAVKNKKIIRARAVH